MLTAPYGPNAEMSDGFAGASQGGPPMKTDDLIKIEHYRRFLRPDWRRLLPPEPERGLTCEQIKAQRHDFMLRDRAFETPLARRLRKEREEREREEQERLEAEHREEIEREALAMKAELASLRVELVWAELRWKAECAERKRRADIAGSASRPPSCAATSHRATGPNSIRTSRACRPAVRMADSGRMVTEAAARHKASQFNWTRYRQRVEAVDIITSRENCSRSLRKKDCLPKL